MNFHVPFFSARILFPLIGNTEIVITLGGIRVQYNKVEICGVNTCLLYTSGTFGTDAAVSQHLNPVWLWFYHGRGINPYKRPAADRFSIPISDSAYYAAVFHYRGWEF